MDETTEPPEQTSAAPGAEGIEQSSEVEASESLIEDANASNATFLEATKEDLSTILFPAESFRCKPVRFNDLLAGRGSKKSYELNKEGFDVVMDSPLFITTVRIVTEGEGSNRLVIKFKSPAQARKENAPLTVAGSEIFGELNSFATSISIFPERTGWFGTSERVVVKSIEISGFDAEKFGKIEQTVNDFLSGISMKETALAEREETLSSRQAELDKMIEAHAAKVQFDLEEIETVQSAALGAQSQAEAYTKAQQDVLSGLIVEITNKQGELSGLEAPLASHRAEHQRLTKELSDLNAKKDGIVQTLVEKSAEVESKTSEIVTKQDHLQKLNNDITLAIDMKGYGRQGFGLIVLYALGISGFAALGFLLAKYALSETEEIWKAYIANPGLLNVSVLVGLKLPFIIVISTLFTALYKLSSALIRRVIQIQDRKLRLSEISVLAGDLTDGALHGSKLDLESRAQVKLAVKMYLVRDLLSGSMDSPSKEEDGEIGEVPTNIVEWVKTLPAFLKSSSKG